VHPFATEYRPEGRELQAWEDPRIAEVCRKGGFILCHCRRFFIPHMAATCDHAPCRNRYRGYLIDRTVEACPNLFLTLMDQPPNRGPSVFEDAEGRKHTLEMFFRALRSGFRVKRGRRRKGERRGRKYPLEYVLIWERTPTSGLLHAHILLRLPLNSKGRPVTIDHHVLDARAWAEGISRHPHILPVGDAEKQSRYLSKYITKVQHRATDGHKYTASRGFFPPVKEPPKTCPCCGEDYVYSPQERVKGKYDLSVKEMYAWVKTVQENVVRDGPKVRQSRGKYRELWTWPKRRTEGEIP
jgi:hypothetical protein